MGYRIVGYDPDDYVEPVPSSIESYWSRTGRYYITILRDQTGVEMDEAVDGTKADRDASVRSFQRRIDNEGAAR